MILWSCFCRYRSSGSTSVFAACLFLAPRQPSLSDSDHSKTPLLAPPLQTPLMSLQWRFLSRPQGLFPPTSPRPLLALCPREAITPTPVLPPPLPSLQPPRSCPSVVPSPKALAMCQCLRQPSLASSHPHHSLAWRTVSEVTVWPLED